MPPYTSQEYDFGPVLNDHDLSLVDVSLDSKPVRERTTETSDGSFVNPIEEDVEESAVEESIEVSSADFDSAVDDENSKPSMFEKMLDFNPCTAKIKNPSSALFKTRICSESGVKVHKLKGGYKKEYRVETIVDEVTNETSEVKTKIYFSPICAELRQQRANHREAGFGDVLTEIVDFFEAKARRKLEEEERLAQMAREAENAASVAKASALAAKNKKSFLKMRFASSFGKRTKKALKSFSWNACRGKQDSTDESAFRGQGIEI